MFDGVEEKQKKNKARMKMNEDEIKKYNWMFKSKITYNKFVGIILITI